MSLNPNTINQSTFPMHRKKKRWENNDKTNATYETTDARTNTNCNIEPHRNDQHKTIGEITKTFLHVYNFDPLKPHFYIVKLGFTGIYIIFHVPAQNIECKYSLEPHRPPWGGSNKDEAILTSTHNLCFEQKHEKYQHFYFKFFIFWW